MPARHCFTMSTRCRPNRSNTHPTDITSQWHESKSVSVVNSSQENDPTIWQLTTSSATSGLAKDTAHPAANNGAWQRLTSVHVTKTNNASHHQQPTTDQDGEWSAAASLILELELDASVDPSHPTDEVGEES